MLSALVSEARTPRLESLTSLRWWVALAVFFFHVHNVVARRSSSTVATTRPAIEEPEKK